MLMNQAFLALQPSSHPTHPTPNHPATPPPALQTGGGSVEMPNAQQLVRDHAFQAFVLSSTLRVLQACAASDSSAAIATGLQGSRAGVG